jgi:tRNA(adenine34) deaminase
MCVGAGARARIGGLLYGARDAKMGVVGGHYDFRAVAKHHHRIEIVAGVLEQDCSGLLRGFFQQERRDVKSK